MSNKANIRKSKLTYRNNLVIEEVIVKSNCIQDKIINSNILDKFDSILAYVSLGNEVKTDFIIDYILKNNKKLYLPKVTSKLLGEMVFYRIENINDLKTGEYNILEPSGLSEEYLYSNCENVLMIVPGVAFDIKCNRIGFGKGYYDKYLNDKPSIYKLGLAFEGQLVDCIESDNNDIKMNQILTEESVYYEIN